MQGPLDWISRVVMLVLAGMVTLSIMGSIAAIPSGIIESRVGMDAERQPEPPQQVPEENVTAPQQQQDTNVMTSAAARGDMVTTAPAPDEPVDPAEWLEAITYALLAIAGLAALGALILWRSLKERRRIADALEILAARPGP
ncbi:MAG TPA: hypothetical protein VGD10_00065 [Allosphingosinicella sp.]|uniref:hypothetical protein n=1 Tax=Allosphingosinicella sp. TaxID=2823234 RepID=UPI002ED9A6D5